MAYDEELAEYIREVVSSEHGLSERRMFGGHAFLIHGNLAVAASGQGGLLLRVDPAQTDSLTADPRASRAVMGSREMSGWLRVQTDALSDVELAQWIGRGVAYARSLPPKSRPGAQA